MTRAKIQIKNYKKFRGKQMGLRTFPRCSPASTEVAVMDSLNPVRKIRAVIVEIGKFGREGYAFVVVKIKCPECRDILTLDERWIGFICTNHDKRRIWEVVQVYESDGRRFK